MSAGLLGRLLSALGWLVRLLIFLVLLGLAMRNSEPVTLHYYFGLEWRAPLVMLLFTFFAAGAILGVIACLGLRRSRRETAPRMKDARSGDSDV